MTDKDILDHKKSLLVNFENRSGNKESQYTFKNTPEDDLDTFCDIISHLTSKYRPDFLELAGPIRFGLVRTLTNTNINGAI